MSCFIPMKITLFLEDGLCKLSDMPCDSILAKLYFQQQINLNKFNGDYKQQLPFLKFSDGIYHTSKPNYTISHISNEIITKKFDYKYFIALNGDISSQKTLSNKVSGRYKNHIISYEVIFTKEIVYYINGDIDIVKNLLKNLNYIGKKTALGWGKISKITIDEIDNDLSLFKNNIPNRHLPNIKKYKTKNMALLNIPLIHPYWKVTDELSLIYIGVHNE